MSHKEDDKLIVKDATGRRTFLRRGAVFIAGTSAMSSSMNVLADDCDRGVVDGAQKQATAGSDSDAGSGADPAGCGRKKDEVPARFNHDSQDAMEIPEIVSIDAKDQY